MSMIFFSVLRRNWGDLYIKKVNRLLPSEVTEDSDEETGEYVLGRSRLHDKSPDRIPGDHSQLSL
jgi:hypothetical protein